MPEVQAPAGPTKDQFLAAVGVKETKEPPKEETPKEEPKTETPPEELEKTEPVAEEPDPDTEGSEYPKDKAGKEPEPEAVKPGTPDKALQKIQRRLSDVDTKLEKLLETKEEQGSLTAAQVAEARQLTEARDELKEMLEKDYEPDGYKLVGKRLLLAEAGRTSDQKRIEALEATVQEQRRDTFFAKESATKGVDCEAIWVKAVDDVTSEVSEDLTGVLGRTPTEAELTRAINQRATREYNARVANASKSVTAKATVTPAEAAAAAKKTTPTKAAGELPPVTPGGRTEGAGSHNNPKPLPPGHVTPAMFAAAVKRT
jgi:hypothetical protein